MWTIFVEKVSKMENKIKVSFLINLLFYSVIAVIVYFLLRFSLIYLFPVIIGIIVTVLVQRPSDYISKKFGVKKGICAMILVVMIYSVLIFSIMLIIYKSYGYISKFAEENSSLLSDLSNKINEFTEEFKLSTSSEFLNVQINKITTAIINGVTDLITDFMKKTASAAPMFLTGSVATVIASCYIAKDYDRFKDSIRSIITEKWSRIILEIKSLLSENVVKLLIGYMKMFLITFMEILVGLLLFNVKNAIVISLVIALLDLLPIIGTGTILIPWGLYRLFISDYALGAGLLILYAIITVIRNIIEPKVIGKQIGLHPLFALLSVFIGLKLFGFVGIFVLPISVMLVYKMFDRGIFAMIFDK